MTASSDRPPHIKGQNGMPSVGPHTPNAPSSAPTGGGPRTRLTPEEFAQRFQEASRLLWCVACGVVADRAAAEDVLQDSAMIALGKLDDYEPGTHFTAWMTRIVRYTALNQVRRLASRRRTEVSTGEEDDMERFPARGDEPARGVNGAGVLAPDQTHFDDRVVRALQGVGETARACLLLRVVGDLDYREISAALEIPEGTAMSHVHRARKSLRDLLSTDPVTEAPR